MVQKRFFVDWIFDVCVYLIYGIFALLCAFPFYFILINTISDNSMVTAGLIIFTPKGIHFDNYVQVFQLEGLGNATFISLARTVIGTFFSVLSASFLGYCMSRKEYWGRTFWYRFIVITMYFNAGLIPWFINMRNLGMFNTFWAYVLPAMTGPFNVILIKTYLESIPPALEESAQIDGAGYLKRYMLIILPMAKPILATVAIFAAVGQWNSFMDTVFLITKDSLFTLQYILYRYLTEAQQIAALIRRSVEATQSFVDISRIITPMAVRYTVTAVTVLPILLVYPFFQKFFVKGIMLGAVKG